MNLKKKILKIYDTWFIARIYIFDLKKIKTT